MSFDAVDQDVTVDLSNLIGVSLTFAPLQLTLQGILRRLTALEEENARKDGDIATLKGAVEALQAKEGEEQRGSNGKDSPAGCDDDGEHEAIWAEIDHLNDILGELRDQEKERHTIDELYAARKRRDSHVSRTSMSHSADHRPQSSHEVSQARSSLQTDGRPPSSSKARPESGSHASALPLPPPRQSVAEQDGEHSSSGDGGGAAAGRFFAYESEAPTPLGDKVLSKAHEPLAGFDETIRYADRGGSAEQRDVAEDNMGGDSMQPQSGASEHPFTSNVVVGGRPSVPSPTSYEQRRASRIIRRSTHGGSTSPATEAAAAAALAAARRQSQHQSAATAPSTTVSERLQKDSEDIAYLNRVVAEILGEMKSLHDNVDLLQTVGGAGHADNGGDAVGVNEDTRDRLRALEKRVAELQDALGRQQEDNGDLRGKLEELKRSVKPATRLTEDDVDNVKALRQLQERVRALEDALNAAGKANERLQEKLQSIAAATGGGGDAVDGISAAQFALLQGTVSTLEKQLEELQRGGAGNGGVDYGDDINRLQEALRRLQADTADLEAAVDRNTRECVRLQDTKADKKDVLGALADMRTAVDQAAAKADSSGGGGNASEIRLNDLQSMLEDAVARIRRLDDDKADRTALQRLRDDLAALKRLMELNAQRGAAAAAATAKDSGANGGASGAALDEAFRELQQQLLAQGEECHKNRESTCEDMDALRDLVDQLDRRKADAKLVANKAERDYVENALERLMREVEQVLNATNAGLIDTLDKSLNILRDMIDGKANRHDIQRLQQQMAADGSGGGSAAADGLTGFKGYRCLGCNRPMETLRPRSTAPKMSTFLNRIPQNYPQDGVTRTIQQQQQLAMTSTAHSEPLPPIEEGPRL